HPLSVLVNPEHLARASGNHMKSACLPRFCLNKQFQLSVFLCIKSHVFPPVLRRICRQLSTSTVQFITKRLIKKAVSLPHARQNPAGYDTDFPLMSTE